MTTAREMIRRIDEALAGGYPKVSDEPTVEKVLEELSAVSEQFEKAFAEYQVEHAKYEAVRRQRIETWVDGIIEMGRAQPEHRDQLIQAAMKDEDYLKMFYP